MRSMSRNVLTVLTLVSTTTAYMTASTSRRDTTTLPRVPSMHRRLSLGLIKPSHAHYEFRSDPPSSERILRHKSSHTLQMSNENNDNNNSELAEVVEKKELGIWAARGILLVVAAVWGTNFAVCIGLHTRR